MCAPTLVRELKPTFDEAGAQRWQKQNTPKNHTTRTKKTKKNKNAPNNPRHKKTKLKRGII